MGRRGSDIRSLWRGLELNRVGTGEPPGILCSGVTRSDLGFRRITLAARVGAGRGVMGGGREGPCGELDLERGGVGTTSRFLDGHREGGDDELGVGVRVRA